MKVREIMTRNVESVQPNDSLQTAAQKMKKHDVGFLPVVEGDQVIGVLSDRDIVLRTVADGIEPKAIIRRDLATSPAICCFDDQDVEEAAKLMEENRIRRLVVLNRNNKRMSGVVSLGDIAASGAREMSAEVMQSISE